MSLELSKYLNKTLEAMHISSYCKLTHAVNDCKEISILLQAAGHNTADLDKAIKETNDSIDKLKTANKAAVCKFQTEGIHIKTEDKEQYSIESIPTPH